MLHALNFDPKELRGIAIHIQKLEPASDNDGSGGQTTLQFAQVGREKVTPPTVVVHPPTMPSPRSPLASRRSPPAATQQSLPPVPVINVLPPSQPSQPTAPASGNDTFPEELDPDFLAALPPDIRKEVEEEHAARRKRAGQAPVPVASSSKIAPDKDKLSPNPPQRSRSRSPSSSRRAPAPGSTQWEPRIVENATRRRVAHVLSRRNTPVLTKSKTTYFERRSRTTAKLNVPIANLKKLGIDPAVFAALDIADQREQLAIQRALKRREGKIGNAFRPRAKVVAIGRVEKGKKFVPRILPPPTANKVPDPIFVRKASKERSESRLVTKEELQDIAQGWVEQFSDQPPRERDIDYFARFLEKCVDHLNPNEVPIETAVAVMKWWRICLDKKFPEPAWSSGVRKKKRRAVKGIYATGTGTGPGSSSAAIGNATSNTGEADIVSGRISPKPHPRPRPHSRTSRNPTKKRRRETWRILRVTEGNRIIRKKIRKFNRSLPLNPPPFVDIEDIGNNWWVAFWEVKERMDVALRPKFGGIISLK
jgi:DNA repair protein REV1